MPHKVRRPTIQSKITEHKLMILSNPAGSIDPVMIIEPTARTISPFDEDKEAR